jgi:uncharacterized hydrophobic protein (TIGR00271 family)
LAVVIHLRIVAPPDKADRVVDLLTATESTCNVIRLPGAAQQPDGDVILVDVAREEGSVIVSDLRELGIGEEGSIAVEEVDTQISRAAERAIAAARGAPADSVVWEEVEARTSESAELSRSFLAFMVLATLIAAVGILLDTPILIIGAMVVGPEFGPIAGFCVAAVQRRRGLAQRSAVALAVGFPVGITAAFLATLAFRVSGLGPARFMAGEHQLAQVISSPDAFALFVALCAGVAGMLSLTTAKSGALIGVLISVTTIPAAANIGVSAAYGDGPGWTGSMAQLAVNLSAILAAGMTTLAVERWLYRRRRARHLRDPARASAGLPTRGRGGAARAAAAAPADRGEPPRGA